jgi:hypothetical protein
LAQREKLIARLLGRPKDFTFQEAASLLGHFGYNETTSGKTGGSRVAFANSKRDYIRMHKPHPRNILKEYQVEFLVNKLKERGLL